MSKLRFSSFGFTTQQAEKAVNWLIVVLILILFAMAGCALS